MNSMGKTMSAAVGWGSLLLLTAGIRAHAAEDPVARWQFDGPVAVDSATGVTDAIKGNHKFIPEGVCRGYLCFDGFTTLVRREAAEGSGARPEIHVARLGGPGGVFMELDSAPRPAGCRNARVFIRHRQHGAFRVAIASLTSCRSEAPVDLYWKNEFWPFVDEWRGLGVYEFDDGIRCVSNGLILNRTAGRHQYQDQNPVTQSLRLSRHRVIQTQDPRFA